MSNDTHHQYETRMKHKLQPKAEKSVRASKDDEFMRHFILYGCKKQENNSSQKLQTTFFQQEKKKKKKLQATVASCINCKEE